MANKRMKTYTIRFPVVDCDECGTEICELDVHERFRKAWYDDDVDWIKIFEEPHRDLCSKCCDGGCIDGQNVHC